MFNFDQLRSRQEQRLLAAVETWNEAKEHLENAIALAEAKEREYSKVAEDVRRRLEALELVGSMARELGGDVPADRSIDAAEKQPMLMPPEKAVVELKVAETPAGPVPVPGPVTSGAPESHGFNGFLHRSSRPLFPSNLRKYARLSILQ
jgi:hypothetical protein